MLVNVDFSGATLDNASFAGATLWSADFTDASVYKVNLNGAIIDGVSWGPGPIKPPTICNSSNMPGKCSNLGENW